MCMATRPIMREWWWPTLWVGPGGGQPSYNVCMNGYQSYRGDTSGWGRGGHRHDMKILRLTRVTSRYPGLVRHGCCGNRISLFPFVFLLIIGIEAQGLQSSEVMDPEMFPGFTVKFRVGHRGSKWINSRTCTFRSNMFIMNSSWNDSNIKTFKIRQISVNRWIAYVQR